MPESINKGQLETKELVLQSLSFLVKERNQTLFKLSNIKIRFRELEQEKSKLINNNRLLKQRIINELDKHQNILTKDERDIFIESSDE